MRATLCLFLVACGTSDGATDALTADVDSPACTAVDAAPCSCPPDATPPDVDAWVSPPCGMEGQTCCPVEAGSGEAPCLGDMECIHYEIRLPHGLWSSGMGCFPCGGLGEFCCNAAPKCADGLTCTDLDQMPTVPPDPVCLGS